MPSLKRAFLAVSDGLKSIVKHNILGVGRKGDLCKNGGVMCKELHLWNRRDCTCVKIFSGINFF